MDAEALYARLPPRLQDAAVSLEGWRVKRRRYGGDFRRLLADYESRSSSPHAEVCGHRDRRLAATLASLVRVPVWAARLREAGVDPAEIRGLADLHRLPILPKSEVRAHPRRFDGVGARDAGVTWSHTSGTTGAGLRFPVTLSAHREQWAVWWRFRRWHGIELDTPSLVLGGRSIVPPGRGAPFWRFNRPGRQLLYSAYHLRPENARAYLRSMRESGFPWLHGYPSMVALLANLAIDQGVRLPLRWVTLGAESVLESHHAAIERAFGVRPIQHYGMAEGVANVSECPRGALHVDEDYAAVEFVRIPGTDQFRIVGTGLTNDAYPLVRYDVGDVARLDGEACPCGRPGRIVRDIDGRIEDYVVTRSGARLGRLDHVFKDMERVREAQIRQRSPGKVTVCVVPSTDWSDRDHEALERELRLRVGDDVRFDIRLVDRIERTSGGKLRFVVSEIEDDTPLA